MKTIIALLILFCATQSHAQDPMAKWKPNVGDVIKYVSVSYYYRGRDRAIYDSSHGRDTVTVEIIKTDSIFDSKHTGVVLARSKYSDRKDSTDQLFYFHIGQDSGSSHALAIDELPYYSFADARDTGYDFSKSLDTQFSNGTKLISGYRYDKWENTPFVVGYMVAQRSAIYSPDVRWFVYLRSYDSGYWTLHEWSAGADTMTLLTASILKVQDIVFDHQQFIVTVTQEFIRIGNHGITALQSLYLLDPLGRPVRSWALAATDGPREITLNVADVPSGVYFLRLQGSGVDEVRKVLIR